MKNTSIGWCHHTHNPWRGCAHLILADGTEHPGCLHCYAQRQSVRFPEKLGKWGADGTRVMAPENLWREVLRWNAEAQAASERHRVFCASIADVFEDWDGDILDNKGRRLWVDRENPLGVDGFMYESAGYSFAHCRPARMADLRAKLFELIDATPWLDWLLLTKRPGNILRMWPDGSVEPNLLPHSDGRSNVWLGTSVSNQATADELIPQLLQARNLAPVLFLSAEPLLGTIDLSEHQYWQCPVCRRSGTHDWSVCSKHGPMRFGSGIDWVIPGCESNGQRVGSLGELKTEAGYYEAALGLQRQCQAAGVAVFQKQAPVNGLVAHELDQFPEAIRVREFPLEVPS